MAKIIVNGEGAVFGRMATFISKELLRGNSVEVINSDKVIVSGNAEVFIAKINQKRKMGSGSSLKGPKYIRQEDRLLKRMIRGMLPWNRARGREAFKRLRCYTGAKNLDEETLKSVKKFEHKNPRKFSTIKEIVRRLK